MFKKEKKKDVVKWYKLPVKLLMSAVMVSLYEQIMRFYSSNHLWTGQF